MLAAVLDIFKTVAVHLLREIIHHLNQALVSRGLYDDVVEGHIGLGDFLGVFRGHALLEMTAGFLQLW